jgi:3,4-dihydroxy 2-butanone 4-phosphate synthase / GTP cyclohydrolase II
MRRPPAACPRTVAAFALERAASTRLPTPHGEFRLIAYRDPATGAEPLAFVGGTPPAAGAHVRVQIECPVADTLRSTRCDCAALLAHGLEETSAAGGVLLYLRAAPGGLLDRLSHYARQDASGGPSTCSQTPRGYEVPAAILRDLGLDDVVLHSADPRATVAFGAHEVRVTRQKAVTLPSGR